MDQKTVMIDDGDDVPQAGGHPVIATIAGCVVILLLAMQSASQGDQGADEASTAHAAGEVFGRSVAMTAIVWGSAYAITIRHASTRWKVASASILGLLSLLISFADLAGRGGARAEAARQDFRDTAGVLEKIANSGNNPPEQVQSGVGPVSRMTAAALNPKLAERNAFERAAEDLGTAQVIGFQGLVRSSPVLGRCGEFAGLADTARANAGHGDQHLAAARAVGDDAVRNGEITASQVEEFLAGAAVAGPRYRRQWELNAAIMDEAAGICRVLAQKRWVMSKGKLLFEQDADLRDTNARLARIRRYSEEQERAAADAKESARSQIDTIKAAR